MTDAEIKTWQDKASTKPQKIALLKVIAARAITATAEQPVKQELQLVIDNN